MSSDSDVMISVRGVSKSYTIAAAKERATTLSELIMDRIRHPTHLIKKRTVETFWALNDVSFDIQCGDVVGIIGRNGAGKSTLLKILSRIAEPTSGQIDLYGRVGSLLEVGTGFHAELTGRENIYLNGAILGMSSRDIRKQFDQIVDFSGVGVFLDTPVKRYSSGMYVRLAFAVAAHLHSEILIVDEVLAVGDVEFQKKCIGKMKDVSSSGRTVIFVSHNMAAIKQLCNSCIFLQKGTVVDAGPLNRIVPQYFKLPTQLSPQWTRSSLLEGHASAYIKSAMLSTSDGTLSTTFPSDDHFVLTIKLHLGTRTEGLQVAVRVTDEEGTPVFTTASTDFRRELHILDAGDWIFKFECPQNLLRPGMYSLIIAVFKPGEHLFDCVDGDISLVIEDAGSHATTLRDGRLGIVSPLIQWSISEIQSD